MQRLDIGRYTAGDPLSPFAWAISSTIMNIRARISALGPCARVLGLTLGAAAALLLAGCGGGGSGDGNTVSNEPPAAEPASPSDFLLIGTKWYLGETTDIQIVDPADPAHPRLVIDSAVHYQTMPSHSIDAATGTTTVNGESMAFYVKHKRVFQVSLRKREATVAKRISSIDAACFLSVIQLSNDDAWIEVEEAGPDADCYAMSDNNFAYVRAGTPETAPPARLPRGVRYLAQLRDSTASILHFLLMHDSRPPTPKLSLYSPDMILVGDVAGSENTPFQPWISPQKFGLVGPQAYMKTRGALRRLSWSSTGAWLSASLHDLTLNSGARHLQDNEALYFLDGTQGGIQIKRMADNAAPELLALLDSAYDSPGDLIAVTPTRLIFTVYRPGTDAMAGTHIMSMPKQGGAVTSLAVTPFLASIFVSGEDVFYTSSSDGVVFGPHFTIRKVTADGSASVITTTATSRPRAFFNRHVSLSRGRTLEGLMWCESLAVATDCHNGKLKSFLAKTGQTLDLGEFAEEGDYGSWDPFALVDFQRFDYWSFTDAPLALVAYGQTDEATPRSLRKMFVVQPDKPNSLTPARPTP